MHACNDNILWVGHKRAIVDWLSMACVHWIIEILACNAGLDLLKINVCTCSKEHVRSSLHMHVAKIMVYIGL